MSIQPFSRTASFELPLACTAALPWFTADGERLWAPGWNPEIVSGNRERGSVFRTMTAAAQVATWVVLDYHIGEHTAQARYARVVENDHAGLIEVALQALPASRTRVDVRYTLSALCEAAVAQLQEFFQPERYDAMIAGWGELIVAALKNGKTAC